MYYCCSVSVFTKVKSEEFILQRHISAAEIFERECVFCSHNAIWGELFDIFNGLQFSFYYNTIWAVDGQAVSLLLESEENDEIVVVNVSNLQYMVLYRPINIAARHVACAACRECVYLA